MKESKPKICKMPGCKKETFDKKAFFCGEHDREFRFFLSGAKKVSGGLAIAALTFIAKNVVGKKK